MPNRCLDSSEGRSCSRTEVLLQVFLVDFVPQNNL
ncbi:unnamed protein product [Phytomonas sp. Hart1]|nr:unnamed protein product [Phytomonas sp. Hart1]|eukprot:CCW66471.1 unnamed protein product [Phytomonas sp. isolate Hart1]